MSDDDGYHVGAQDITLQMKDGKFRTFPCRYPPEHVTWSKIAEQKLRETAARDTAKETAKGTANRLDAEKILDIVSRLETEPNLDRLIAAMTRTKAAEAASPAPATSAPGNPPAPDVPQKISA
jgi:hypothetical protein